MISSLISEKAFNDVYLCLPSLGDKIASKKLIESVSGISDKEILLIAPPFFLIPSYFTKA